MVYRTCFTGLIMLYSIFSVPVFAQGIVPKISEPIETGKRLPAMLIIFPVIVEFFEAPLNTQSIDAIVKEYRPGDTSPARYSKKVQVDKAANTITEISSPISNEDGKATKKIYHYSAPARLTDLKYYGGNNNNWVLEQEDIYTYPGMGGNRSLPMRKTRKIIGSDTSTVIPSQEDTYVYDSHMRITEVITKGQIHNYRYNNQHDLSSEKITTPDGKWRLLEYVYQYEDGYWIKRDEFETTSEQQRYLKKSIERKINFQ